MAKKLFQIPDSRIYGVCARMRCEAMAEAVQCYQGKWIVAISRNGMCADQDKNLPIFASSVDFNRLKSHNGYVDYHVAKAIVRSLINS